jgi:hypothetical protein
MGYRDIDDDDDNNNNNNIWDSLIKYEHLSKYKSKLY